ncbi:MAG: Flp pilus assembly protein CpaB [Bryobacteraceae bacterium]|nr:Flp pilus assembly protein CpaB [Bryobacteraceae bacterium]
MDRRFLTVLGLSLSLALVVSLVFYQFVASREPVKAEAVTTKDLVVAVKPLSIGVTIKAEDLKINKVPVSQFPKGAFTKVEEVIDRPVISNVLMEEPVLEGRLAARGAGVGLAPVIPVGMRAVSVRVTDVAGVAGFVLPGLRVDVLVTGHPPNSQETITTTCLQNILVLGAGQTIQTDGRGLAIQTPTVTLLVTLEQAEKLTLAGSQGSVQLVLRNSGDQEMQKTSGSELSALYRTSAPKPVEARPRPAVQPRPRPAPVAVAIAPPPQPPAIPLTAEVIVIRGNIRSVETAPSKGN